MNTLAFSIENYALVTYWLGMAAVAAMAGASVVESGAKQFDLFGVIVIALAASLGGGSLRDMLLDRPVFWIADELYLLIAIMAAVSVFFLARWLVMPVRAFLILDAIGLALFSIMGTHAALVLGTSWLVASFTGVITGVMGGVFRDVLCNEDPWVFRSPLFATASWLGCWLYILMVEYNVGELVANLIASTSILLIRLYALRKGVNLPRFREKIKRL
jgi:uncharacterized membrane protein YeiH